MIRTLFFITLCCTFQTTAQLRPIKVVVEEIPNRRAFYAINENEIDLDVMLTIKGTNFRQSSARPRLIRVPATSKVHMKTIILLRGKKPSYTYDLVVNDSLSKRALKKEFKLIKIKPKKSIIVYIPKNCVDCDSLDLALSESIYHYESYELSKRSDMTDQLQRLLGSTSIDSLKMPIVNIGGKLFTKINTYDQVLEELQKE